MVTEAIKAKRQAVQNVNPAPTALEAAAGHLWYEAAFKRNAFILVHP
jgi:hypothetical protein